MAEPTNASDVPAVAPLPAPEAGALVAGAERPPVHEHIHRMAPERRPVRWGRGGLALAVLMIAVLVAALGVDAPGRYLTSTVLAYVADGLSLLAVVLGIVGVAANRGRGAGIAALVIAVLGNPLVLLYGLGALT